MNYFKLLALVTQMTRGKGYAFRYRLFYSSDGKAEKFLATSSQSLNVTNHYESIAAANLNIIPSQQWQPMQFKLSVQLKKEHKQSLPLLKTACKIISRSRSIGS